METLATINNYAAALAKIVDLRDARQMMHLAEALVTATTKEYKATIASSLPEAKSNRDNAYQVALRAAELRLRAEARLGELIQQEQEAGRLAIEGRPKKGNNGITFLKDIGLTKMDSMRAQRLAANQDLIPVVVAKALEQGDVPTRKDFDNALKETVGKTLRNGQPRVTLPDFLNEVNPIFYEFSVWEVPERRPQGGDANFRGNCSPYVCAGCLYNYSKAGDTVMDPMAGSGTFLDVASAVTDTKGSPAYQEVLAFDLNPVRADIKRADASHLFLPDNHVDMFFAHWPYWNAIDFAALSRERGCNPNTQDALERMDFTAFAAKSKSILRELLRILKPDGYLCLMVGAKRQDGLLCDLPFALKSWAVEAGLLLYDEVIVMTYNPRKVSFDSASGQRRLHIGNGRHDNALNICSDYILVFRKANV